MKRFFTWRCCWNRGKVGDGKGYSNEVSVAFGFEPRDIWVGLYWTTEHGGWIVYLCLIPCFPLRLHRKWSYGGIFPPRNWLGKGV